MDKRVIQSLPNTRATAWLRSLLPNSFVNLAWHLPKAMLANLMYSFPAKKLTIIGVTGTKGKTTTAHMIFHILRKQKKKAVMISTLGAFFGDKQIDTGLHVTNPEPFTLQKLLRQAVREGFEFVILEVTSHGLSQYRNWGISFKLGVFTQVQSDHITYHGGVDKYKKAKAKLINKSGKVILNNADPSFDYLKSLARQLSIPTVVYKGKGKSFQSQNEQAALLVATQLGIDRAVAIKALKSFSGVPGRLEIIKDKPFTVVIDFAHTRDSLEAVLNNLRPLVSEKGRLIAVFGCAGGRDPRRRKMGEVAARFADFFIITAEDPRTEGVEKISEEIAQHATKADAEEISLSRASELNSQKKTTFIRIPDRTKAINFAITVAKAGDVVGFFGKGHEQSMCFGTTEHPWSEHKTVRKALKRRER